MLKRIFKRLEINPEKDLVYDYSKESVTREIDQELGFNNGEFFPCFAVDNKVKFKNYFSNVLGSDSVNDIYPIFRILTKSNDLLKIEFELWSTATEWADQFENKKNIEYKDGDCPTKKNHVDYLVDEILIGKWFREFELKYPEARNFLRNQNPRNALGIGSALRRVYGSRDTAPNAPLEEKFAYEKAKLMWGASLAAAIGSYHAFGMIMRQDCLTIPSVEKRFKNLDSKKVNWDQLNRIAELYGYKE